jgi:hypothetical protein
MWSCSIVQPLLNMNICHIYGDVSEFKVACGYVQYWNNCSTTVELDHKPFPCDGYFQFPLDNIHKIKSCKKIYFSYFILCSNPLVAISPESFMPLTYLLNPLCHKAKNQNQLLIVSQEISPNFDNVICIQSQVIIRKSFFPTLTSFSLLYSHVKPPP